MSSSRRSRRSDARLVLLALLALGVGSGMRCVLPPLIVAWAHTTDAAVWERFETRGRLHVRLANAFDPASLDLRGEFRAPDGTRVSMPGFLHREYARSLVGGFEKLVPLGPAFPAVRFTPTEAGTWRWRWVAEAGGARLWTPWREIEVAPPRPDAHGFVRPSPLDPAYLRHDDGTPYLAIGENLAWYDGRGTFAYDDWVAQLEAAGATYVRLWMPSWAFGLEWIAREASGAIVENTLGDYAGRLDRAWQLDRVLETLEAAGIHAMLNLQNHGPFSLDTNSEWADNPYHAANGGPLASPSELFTDAEARELFRRRLRYVVARWGYSTAILAWELWNEVNFVEGGSSPAVLDFQIEMAAHLKALDPHDRMVTTSRSSFLPAADVLHPTNELVQTHQYMWPLFDDTAQTLADIAAIARQPGRPYLVSEFGADFRGPAETLAGDPGAVAFHNGLWAPLLAGAAGSGMTWWWDNVIDPEDLYVHIEALARFVEGIAFDEEGFAPNRPDATAPGRSLAAYALLGPERVLAWVRNADHDWVAPDASPIVGATLALPALPAGAWEATWVDPYTGDPVATVPVASAGGATLAVPDFARDVALDLRKR